MVISPDGQWILYQTSEQDRMFIVNVKDSTVQALTGLARNAGALWLPDGSRIFSIHIIKGRYHAYLYDPDTGRRIEIEAGNHLAGDANFTLLDVAETAATLLRSVRLRSGMHKLQVIPLCLN